MHIQLSLNNQSSQPGTDMAARQVIPIDKKWKFKQADKDDTTLLPVSQFPTNVHLDLLHHKLIPDPNIGKNELDVQWVGEQKWVYQTTFASPALSRPARATLVFGGLDTFATVVLNGQTILESENMFTPERVDVTNVVTSEKENELVITFDSALLRGQELVKKYPDHKWGVWNGDLSRLAVRKAQYHYGWDWGPTLMTCGPWKPIHLELSMARITDLYTNVELLEDFKVALVTAYAPVEGRAIRVRFDLTLRGEHVATNTVDVRERTAATATFALENPELWYPRRYGKQPLYEIKATILMGLVELDSLSKKIGLRQAKVVQRPVKDQPGTSFFFEINNIPIFCGGSNWIPADNFIPRISKERYRDWVKLVADGNQFMLRVWGGGIYEEQALYDACDELGILVWQDFMFACGNYPTWPEMRDSIQREAIENLRRLRHHPSIVLFAGNNEDYQYADSVGLTYDPNDKDPESWLKTDFPARYIYEKLLPDVCDVMVPNTYYHWGSPSGGKWYGDTTGGDIHQWNVWHGTQEKYQNFDKLVGRFVSEFGMEAFPSIKTIDAYLPLGKDDPDRFAQSSTVDFHNKADGHERRLALYLAENIRYAPDPLEYFVYCTQLMQAECLASAYRLWKRQWKGPGQEYCGGALVWQINDCWPVTSWAIADYYLRPKHAYYTVKREMAPISVGMTRREKKTSKEDKAPRRTHVDTRYRIEIWGSNLQLENLTVDCVVKAWDVVTGEETYSQTVASGITLPENRSTEIFALDVPVKEENVGLQDRTVVAAYLYQRGHQVARYVNWPEPLKYVHLQKPKELRAVVSEDGGKVSVSAEVPVKGVALETEDTNVKFEDNLVDVVPGEAVSVGITGGTKATVITTQYLGMPN